MGRTFPYRQIDVFASQPLRGNPCAVIYEADTLAESEMQAIAAEMNFSETVFVCRSATADLKLLFYTPSRPIPLAGHPTIGAVSALYEDGLLPQDLQRVSVELLEGTVSVEIEPTRAGTIFSMQQFPPQFMNVYPSAPVLEAFSLSGEDLVEGAPLQTVSTGTAQLMVPVRNLRALEKAVCQTEVLRNFEAASDFSYVHLFCLEGFTPEGRVAARNFAPPPDVIEDSFTGSGMGPMGCYLWRYGLLKETSYSVQQGYRMGRPGEGRIDLIVEQGDVIGVRVGGQARCVVRGELKLD